MNTKKLISFDLDSTLINPTFNTFVWEIGIPSLYAKKYEVSLLKAESIVKGEYERVGDGALEWYDIAYWFRFFELPGRWQDLMDEYRDKIRVLPEVKDAIVELVESYNLIIVSNAAREFIEIEIEEAEIKDYFTRIFSVTSDFGQVKKTLKCFEAILRQMGTTPSQAIHVGDHYEFDYVIPKRLGMEAYFLDRDGGKPKDGFTVTNLREFADIVKNRELSR